MFSSQATQALFKRHPLASLVAVALSTVVATAAHAATYSDLLNPSYYDPPAGWQNQPRGTLLNASLVSSTEASRIMATFDAKADYTGPVKIWRIKYTTTGADANLNPTTPGAPLLATGIVIVPFGVSWNPTASTPTRPVILFAPKTQGMGSKCAPSKALELGKEETSEVKRMAVALSEGYAVAITDYDGYINNSQAHQYLVGQTLGHAVLDLGLAFKQAVPTLALQEQYDASGNKKLNVATTSPMVIWGYSEGGTAAGWAGQLLASYAPTLQPSIKGIATGGTVADMKLAAKTLDSNVASALMLAAVWGYHVAYPKPYEQGGVYFDLNDTFKQDLLGSWYSYKYQLNPPSTDSDNAILDPEECVDQLVLDHPFKTIRLRNNGGYTITELINTPSLRWGPVLSANSLGAYSIPVPTYFYFGTVATSLNSDGTAKEGDAILPAANFNGLATKWCANGTNLRKTIVVSNAYLAAGHEAASDKAFVAVKGWIRNQFNGVSTPTTTTTTPQGDTLVTTTCN